MLKAHSPKWFFLSISPVVFLFYSAIMHITLPILRTHLARVSQCFWGIVQKIFFSIQLASVREGCHKVTVFCAQMIRSRPPTTPQNTCLFTHTRCPHSGEGEDFLRRRRFFTKTAKTRERKVKKSLPTWEMNRLSEGFKRAVAQNWGRMAKIGFFGQKLKFWVQKKGFTFSP